MRGSLEWRFWAKLGPGGVDDCWLWTGSTNTSGYGQIADDEMRLQLCHRVAWIMAFGPIPEGMLVLHRCDTPACCNPHHLFLGTQKDNVADCIAKGRRGTERARGEDHGGARLTEQQVRTIRSRREAGELTRVLAAEFGVDRRQIGRIARRERWAHVA